MQAANPISTNRPAGRSAWSALALHWPEYLMEAAHLGLFMISACIFGVLLDHQSSPLHQAVENATLRRVLGGLAMGATAVSLISSPWGQRSGAHMNPAFTLTFYVLGKIERWDAVFYALSQTAGGVAGVAIASLMIGPPLTDSPVHFVATLPGPSGPATAFLAELLLSFLLVYVVLHVSNHPRWTHLTPWIAGALVASFISIEAPLSGMSINPARTLGSAVFAADYTALWIYFTAPPLGMLLAAGLYRGAGHAVFCAKYHHHNGRRCIFRCRYSELLQDPRR